MPCSSTDMILINHKPGNFVSINVRSLILASLFSVSFFSCELSRLHMLTFININFINSVLSWLQMVTWAPQSKFAFHLHKIKISELLSLVSRCLTRPYILSPTVTVVRVASAPLKMNGIMCFVPACCWQSEWGFTLLSLAKTKWRRRGWKRADWGAVIL